MTRRFVALVVPAALREQLPARIGSLGPDLRPARPEGWHLTLAFLGELADERVPEVAEMVGEAIPVAPAPWLRIAGPMQLRGSVLCCRIADDPDGAVGELSAHVQGALSAAGLPVQRRRVRPHVTIARARTGARVQRPHVERLGRGLEGLPEEATVWRPEALEVWSSLLGRGPARYVAEASVPLDGA